MELVVLGLLVAAFYVFGVPFWLADHGSKLRDLQKLLANAKVDLQEKAREHERRLLELTTRVRALEAGAVPQAVMPIQPIQAAAVTAMPVVFAPAAAPVPPAPVAPPVAPPAPTAVVREPAAARVAAATPRAVEPALPIDVPPAVVSKPFEEQVVELLTKFGAIIVFLGLAAAASYFWEDFGVFGRVALFVTAGGAMLGTGFTLEKQERYTVLGRSLVGGGWATLFMTAFGAHHFEAIRVIPSLELDLLMVLVVTALMVRDTLRYDSRWVTGLAFGLGFYTVAQSHATAWSLLANVILAGGLIAVVRKRRWYDLELAGLAAAYANHALWLGPHIAAGTVPALQSATVLACYWAAFRASYVWREIRDVAEEHTSAATAVLNTGLVLSVAYYQNTFGHDLGFWAMLALGFTEIGLGRLLYVARADEVLLELEPPTTDRRRVGQSRRTAFLVLSSLGCILILAATPVSFVASPRVLIWAVSAQAMLFAGYFTGEWLFRRFGVAAALMAAGYALATDGTSYMTGVVFAGHDRAITLAGGLLFAAIAVVSYLDAHVVPEPSGIEASSGDRIAASWLSYAGWASLVVAVYMLVPAAGAGVALGVLTCALAFTGSRVDIGELIAQAHITMIMASVDVWTVNADAVAAVRMASFAGVAASAYVAGEVVRRGWKARDAAALAGQLYAWLGTGTLAALVYFETRDWRTAPAWAVLAIVPGMLGRRAKRIELTWQSCALATAAFVGTMVVNLPGGGAQGGASGIRAVSVSFVAAILYWLQRYAPVLPARIDARANLSGTTDAGAAAPVTDDVSVAPLYSWTASLLATWLIWYEVPAGMVSLAWALFGVVLFEIGLAKQSASFAALRRQSFVAVLSAFAHVFIANINAPDTLWYTAGPLVPVFYYMHERLHAGAGTGHAGMAHLLAWVGSLTVFVIVKFMVPADFVVAGWAAGSTALAGAAYLSGRRVFLDQAVVGVAPVAFRGLMYNIYETHLGSLGSRPGIGLIGAAAVLLLALPLLIRMRDRAYQGSAIARLWRRPEQVFFFAAFTLVTVVLAYLLPGVSMTLAWGIEAAAIVAFALALGERSFRLTGLALLVACVAKLGAYDAWHFENALSRILTFTAIGIILLGVSFLYGRLRERIRELL